MVKFIRNIALFSGFAFLLYLLFIYVWKNTLPVEFYPNIRYIKGANGHMSLRAEEVKNTHDVDVLVIGSSHAYRGFDPRIFEANGVKIFNLGSSSQSPFQTKVLLNRYYEQINPKIVLFEVYPKSLFSDGVEASIDLLSNDKNDLHSLKMTLEVNNPKVYNTFFYATLEQQLNKISFDQPLRRGKDVYIPGGYVEKDLKYFTYKKVPTKTWPIKKGAFKGFNEIMDLLEKKDVDIYAIFAPITNALYYSHINTDAFINEIEKRIPVYNFNTLMNLDDSLHFYDPHHLNQKGVALFNKRLIDTLW